MKLNREQIIKALECLLSTDDREFCEAKGCLFADCDSCVEDVLIASLALINELTEDVERVRKQCGEIIVECDEREAERLKQVAELTQAHEMLSESYDHLEKTKDELLAERSRLTEENERLKLAPKIGSVPVPEALEIINKYCESYIKKAKAYTVRKMQERIAEHATNGYPRKVRLDVVDQIAKEMVGGDK